MVVKKVTMFAPHPAFRWLPIALGLLLPLTAVAMNPAAPESLTQKEAEEIQQQLTALDQKLSALRDEAEQADKPRRLDLIADAEIFSKGVAWALRYEMKFAAADISLIKRSLERGQQRADALARGGGEQAGEPGRMACGYVSAVDGSTQPFGLVVPAGYDPQRRIRLDVVLHGSTRP